MLVAQQSWATSAQLCFYTRYRLSALHIKVAAPVEVAVAALQPAGQFYLAKAH